MHSFFLHSFGMFMTSPNDDKNDIWNIKYP